uniref:KH domain containing 3 like, subcortical maternal complex member n=1 Tax=Otolemur garnettii TaxID=30611 RepID=H0XFX2_OTOGA
MAAPKQFPTLIQVQQREGTLFEVPGSNFSKRPYWFHSEFLKSPKTIHLESWLVEAIFGSGRDGERIPHVECISNVLLHVNRWDPKGEAEILIFGRPYYQKDTCKVIMNLADYYRERCEKGTIPGTGKATAVREVGTQQSSEADGEARIQRPPVEVREAGTQWPLVEVQETRTQKSLVEVQEPGAQASPEASGEEGTQPPPEEAAGEAAETQPPSEAARAPITRL